jgi:hypothetical protein
MLSTTTGKDALQQFLGALGFAPGDKLMLAYGEENRLTLLAEVSPDGSLKAQQAVKDKASQTKDYKPKGFGTVYSYQELRELARVQNLFYLPSQATRGRTNHHLPEQAPPYVYAEQDDLPLDEQREFWSGFERDTGLDVLLAYTGGKSLHAYILLDARPTWEQWKQMQQMLCAYALSDIALERPHQPMRLPGFPRIKDGEEREVSLVKLSDRKFSPDDVQARIHAAWPHPKPFDSERWEIFKKLSARAVNPLLGFPDGIKSRTDAFEADVSDLWQALGHKPIDESFTPAEPSQDDSKARTATISGNNPWVQFLDDTLMPAVERLSLAQQFGLSGYPHNFTSQAGGLVGNSPWSPTNSSGNTFQVTSDGKWYCQRLKEGSQSVKQYLQLVWYGREGGQLRGSEFIDFCKRLAAALGVPLPQVEVNTPRTDKPFDLDAYRQRKQAEKAQQVKQWYKDVAALAGAPDGADRAQIAASFDQQHKLSGKRETGTFPRLNPPSGGQRKLTLLDGSKMTRKTSVALRSVVQQGIAKGQSGIIYAPTRVLARALAKELGILTLDQYLAMDEDSRPPRPWLTACPESGWKLQNFTFDVVCFDEGNESTPRAQSGILGNHPHESREVIKSQLRTVSYVVIAQDGLYRPTVRAAMRWGKFDHNQVEAIHRKRPATEMLILLYVAGLGNEETEAWDGTEREKKPQADAAFYTWFDGLVRAVEAGKKVIIPCGSEGKARVIHRVLRSLYPKKKGQVIDGQWTPSSIRTEFADNPSTFASSRGLDWLIFTPTFDSGVSIEGTYFDAQFEYIRAFEAASNASQRGERYRDAIRGQKLTERHIYIATRGLPTMPPVEVFTAEYWKELLSRSPDVEAVNLAKQMGASQLIDRIEQDNPEDWLELPEFMAINARETYFKVELLKQEWKSNGWDVQEGGEHAEAVEKWADKFYLVKEGIIAQKARTLAKAKAKHQDGDEVKGAIEATKHRKWELWHQLGDYPGLNDAEFMASWVVASGEQSLQGLQVRALLTMAHDQPELWAALSQQFALNALARAESLESPELPCSAKIFEIARILKDAPGLYSLISGEVEQWTHRDPLIVELATWARHHAKPLGRLSQHSQRIHGLQFTDKTPDIKCTHKLLSMVGLEAQCLGRQTDGKRLWQYRLKVAGDVEAKLQQKLTATSQGITRTGDLTRQAYRLKTDAEVYQALDEVIQGNIYRHASQWADVKDELLAKYQPSSTSVDRNTVTEVLDKPVFPPTHRNIALGLMGRVVKTELTNAIFEAESGARFIVFTGDLEPIREGLAA